MNVDVTLVWVVCGNCGCPFAFPERMYEERRDNGNAFYCPNGHTRIFRDTTRMKLERAEDRIASLTAAVDQVDADNLRLNRKVDRQARKLEKLTA